MNREEAFEVAKLAAQIGGQLNMIDKMTVDRPNTPANKININEFINAVKNPNASLPGPKQYLTSSSEFAAIPEQLVQEAIPYIPQNHQATIEPVPQTNNSLRSDFPDSGMRVALPTATNNLENITKPTKQEKPIFSRSDIDSVRNSLKNIDKSLAGILEYLKGYSA